MQPLTARHGSHMQQDGAWREGWSQHPFNHSLKRMKIVIQTLSDALAKRGYDTLTPVQTAVSDPSLIEQDLLVSAQTGSGKTVGFGLAIAPNLLGDATTFGQAEAPLALVIAPTRELAMQVKRELAWLYGEAGAVMASCVGGMDMRDERRALARGAHIVVATPGRLRDHIQRDSIDLSSIRAVVLDEADEMLDLGFREDLEFILSEAPESRRTLLFSATVPNSIVTLAKSYQKDAQRITTTSEKKQHSDIEYRALSVTDRDQENAIINTLRFYEAPNAIVFCNTRAMVNRLTTRFSNRGFSVVALSGELTQNERSHALQAMRDGRARVCVATDVAARGIDLPNLELVIHAELPSNFETMLHRSGRTGRAGRKGVSALIVPPKTFKKAQRLLSMAKVTAEWGPAPTADQVIAKDQERLMSDETWETPIAENEQEFVTQLCETFTAQQIAAAYMRLYTSRTSAPEDISDTPPAREERKPRESFGPTVWFALDLGRDKGADPRSLLPMICNAGDITKSDIGAIRIQDDKTYFEIKESSVVDFTAAVGAGMTLEDNVKMEQLASAPDLGPQPRRNSGPRDGHRNERRDDRPRGGHRGKPDGNGFDKRGPKKDFGPRRDRPDFSENRKPRAEKVERMPETPRPERTRPEGVVVPKAPKAKAVFGKGSDSKPKSDSKNNKRDFGGKPSGKPEGGKRPFSGKKDDRPARNSDRDRDDRPKRSGPFGDKPFGGKPKANASDTSKRFTPPGSKPKRAGGKPGFSKGANSKTFQGKR